MCVFERVSSVCLSTLFACTVFFSLLTSYIILYFCVDVFFICCFVWRYAPPGRNSLRLNSFADWCLCCIALTVAVILLIECQSDPLKKRQRRKRCVALLNQLFIYFSTSRYHFFFFASRAHGIVCWLVCCLNPNKSHSFWVIAQHPSVCNVLCASIKCAQMPYSCASNTDRTFNDHTEFEARLEFVPSPR